MWNSNRPLVFEYTVLTKMLGIHYEWEIWERINQHMELWDKGLHKGLMRNLESEGASREVREVQESLMKEYKNGLDMDFHRTVLLGKL